MIDVEANTTKTPAEAAATPEPKMPLTVSCTASCVGLLCNLQGKLSSDSSKVANIRSVWLWFSGHCFKWCLPPPQPQHAHGRTGDVRYAADGRAGVAVAAGTCRKRDVTYPKFTASRRCHLIVCGIETCGRWGDEAIALLCGLAQAKAREAPPYLRGASAGAYTSRWAWPSQPNGRSRRACSSCPWVGSTWCWRTRATTRAHRPVVYLWEGGCTWDTGKKEMSRCFDSSAFRDCIVRIVVAQVSTVPYICTQYTHVLDIWLPVFLGEKKSPGLFHRNYAAKLGSLGELLRWPHRNHVSTWRAALKVPDLESLAPWPQGITRSWGWPMPKWQDHWSGSTEKQLRKPSHSNLQSFQKEFCMVILFLEWSWIINGWCLLTPWHCPVSVRGLPPAKFWPYKAEQRLRDVVSASRWCFCCKTCLLMLTHVYCLLCRTVAAGPTNN